MRVSRRLASLVPALALAASAAAQVHAPPSVNLQHAHDTGLVSNTGASERVVISFSVNAPGAQWMRLYFDEVQLAGDVLAGTGATLRVTSWLDGHFQDMNAIHVQQWQDSTAYFNGDALQVEVIAQPGSGASRIVTRAYDMGLLDAFPESQCGPTDDRMPSSDPRSARFLPIGCTAWLINDCAKCFLTAGHCGTSGVVQFNVPFSTSGGGLVNPPPSDQYSIDPSSTQSNGGQGIGNDWGYFGVFPNSTTGLTPFQAQGSAFDLTAPPPVGGGNQIRITGYGTDNSPAMWNQVQQTHFGPLVTSGGTTVQYQTDTTGGNSGSPVIWEQTGQAVGIHTHGGCQTNGSGQNSGTGIVHSALQNALNNPTGICEAGVAPPLGLPNRLEPGVAHPVSITAFGTPTTVRLHYRYQAGTFTAIDMTAAGGGTFTAQLPAPACGDFAEYFFSVDTGACGLLMLPTNAPNTTYLAPVGQALFADDFETNQGWTTQVAGATAGFWTRGDPVSSPSNVYDPESDSDGSGQCFVTGNTSSNGDVDGGSVRLLSPVLNMTSGPDVAVAFDYFLNIGNSSGNVDSLVLEVSSAGAGGPWTQLAQYTSSDPLWRTDVISGAAIVGAGVPLTANMVLRFTATDGAGDSEVEAGLDAFHLVQTDCTLIGAPYCDVVPNSTGMRAELQAFGSTVAADDDLELVATRMPANRFGYFLASQTQGFVSNPGGSFGNLCLGGTIARFVSQVQSSGPLGMFSIQVDLTAIPLTPPVGVQGGETWNFQGWFRDFQFIDTSNFTNGVSILYQ